MYKTIVLLICTCTAVFAIRCWSGQQTTPGTGTPFQQVNCPAVDFCFNNYVKRDQKDDHSYTITKSCGEVGKCFETGCYGPRTDKSCCCAGDMCNSENGNYIGTAGILTIILGAGLF